ncbi:hypothetical protein ILUMI_20529 [Ignelater luminosus]|uniref:Mutator-like transposase domain-containing protein n=1 Tax=Ignelater luminosus TaxID=2038154 RepID=A0A8K0G4H6_IGNLU|nr:hypothetical protein ILUMI_20529 [Ignelater luminosus]
MMRTSTVYQVKVLIITDPSSAVREDQSQPLDANTEEIKNRSAKEIVLEGKRVVDIQYFLNSLKSIGNHAPWMECSLNNMEITGENRNGLNSQLTFKCNMLNLIQQVSTIPDPEFINDSIVVGAMSVGSGYTHLKQIMSAINVPIFAQSTYDKIYNKVCDAWEETAMEEMTRRKDHFGLVFTKAWNQCKTPSNSENCFKETEIFLFKLYAILEIEFVPSELTWKELLQEPKGNDDYESEDGLPLIYVMKKRDIIKPAIHVEENKVKTPRIKAINYKVEPLKKKGFSKSSQQQQNVQGAEDIQYGTQSEDLGNLVYPDCP